MLKIEIYTIWPKPYSMTVLVVIALIRTQGKTKIE